jgi:hypothetical protein
VLHVYCIRRAGDPPPAPELTGVEGAAVRLLEEGPLGAWVSAGAPRPPTAPRLRAHDAVVRAALRTATPLPARFGDLAPDEAALRGTLRGRAAAWEVALARLADRVEMGIAVPSAGETAPAGVPAATAAPAEAGGGAAGGDGRGHAHLARKRALAAARDAGRRAAGERLDAAEACLGEVAWPVVRTVVAAEGVAGTLAYLVPRSEVGAFRRSAAALAGSLPGPRPIVSGPWAPYSFV